MRRNLIAAIDVGSHAIRMKIGEINRAGIFKELESFRKIAVLGHDTFTTQKMSFESVDKICQILSDFQKTMNDYGVRHYSAMATSAIREARNREYILDQIKIKTGFDVQVIDNAQEQFMTLKAVKYGLENYQTIIDEGLILVVIGAGSIQVTTYQDGELTASQNVKMGALRIKEIFGSMDQAVLKYNHVLEEYIKVNLEGLIVSENYEKYKHLIVVGGEMSVISHMLGVDLNDKHAVSKKEIKGLYRDLLTMTTEEIRHNYNIKRERAEIIVPSLMLLREFMKMTESSEVFVPNVSLVDGIVRDIHENLYNLRLDEAAISDVITNARVIAQGLHYNTEHCQYVEDTAMLFFSKLKKVHGLKYEGLHLQVAAILHDVGKFISLDRHAFHSYDLIRSMELFGMSKTDRELIAIVSKYHGMAAPVDTRKDYGELPVEMRIVAAKLISILRIADSLDRSHGQKITIKSVKVKDKQLIVKGSAKVDTTLEEWNFKQKSSFFQEVFGITPKLTITKDV